MDIYRSYSHVPSSKPPFFTQPNQTSSQQPQWLSRPKEDRLLLRNGTQPPAPFQLGGPGSFPRRDSIQRSATSHPLTSSSMSSIDPYASPVTAEDLRNRYLRESNPSLQNEEKDEKVQEKTYMFTTPNPFLMNGFLRRQGSFINGRPNSASSLPPNLRNLRGQEDGKLEISRKPLVESGEFRPRRPTTAGTPLVQQPNLANIKTPETVTANTPGNSKAQPPTNPMTMFSVVTKKHPQRMVEHSTSVFAKPPVRQNSAPQTRNIHYTPGKPYNLCTPNGDKKEDGDGSESREHVIEGSEGSTEGTRMPVTGTLTSTVFYRKSTKCEELIYRPQSAEKQTPEVEKDSTFTASQSESLYDKVKREVENHRKARQLAKDREKEMDDRQRQLQNSKLGVSKVMPAAASAGSDSAASSGDQPPKQKATKKITTPREVPPNLSSSAGRLSRAVLPGRVSKNGVKNADPTAKTKPLRLNVTKQRQKKDDVTDDEAGDLGERQPGDGEADADEDKSIRTVYSHSYHTRSASSCSTALTIQSDADSDSDDGVDEDANLSPLPIKKLSKAAYQPRSRSRSSSGCRSVLDDDDDVTNIASDSDSDTTIDNVDHRLDDPAICDLDPPASSLSRQEKSRSLPTLSSDSDVDDDDDDDDSDSDEKRRSSASRRSRSASRLSNVASEACAEKTKDPPRPRSAAAISFTTLTERYARKTSSKKGKSPLMPSLFDNIPPCIRFVIDGQKIEPLPWKYRKYLVWRMSTITPVIVKQTIWRSGFRASKITSVIDDLETHESADWIGYFGKHMKAPNFRSLREYQKYNHYPGSFQLGRKDRLWQNLYHMQQLIGKKEYNFFPQTFCLPMDAKLLKKAWDDDGGHKMKWIIKPPASARGQGIRVVHQWCQIPKKANVIVQKYLSHPYLINDSKFDLRVYVYVPSFDPLRVYIHEDGLVRFASQKYSNAVKNLSNRFMHLTNYSVNKQNAEYQSNSDDSVCQGHKWSLRSLWSYLRRKKVNTDKIWDQIKDVIIKTIVAVEGHINTQVKAHCRRKYCVHELFGFDILLDDNLHPWVLECNISPSLHSNSKLDINVKGEMIKDMFNIAGYQIPDRLESGVPSSSYTPSSDIVCDRRLWYCELASDEKEKQEFYVSRAQNEQSCNSILDSVTPEDLRILVESIDEFARAGSFELVFPTNYSRRYLKFFEQVRYANLLLQTYVQRFSNKEEQGISWLNSMCQKRLHLSLPDKAHMRQRWKQPSTPTSSQKISKPAAGDTGKFVTRAV